jgi:hypothetical protein
MEQAETVLASSNIGFAIATIKAFMEPPGVSSKQVHEALRRLEEALHVVSEYEGQTPVEVRLP